MEDLQEMKTGHLATPASYPHMAEETAPKKKRPNRAARLSNAADLLVDKIAQLVLEAEPEVLEPRSIRSLAAALKDLKQVQGVFTPLERKALEARIAKLQAQPREDASDTIEVVFAAGPEGWNE